MWENIANTILRNRLALILFLICTTVLMGYKASQVQLAYDNPKFIPDDDKDNLAYKEFKKTFGDDGSVMVVGINSEKIHQLSFFNKWYDLTHELDSTANIKQVLSIANLKSLEKETVMEYYEEDSFSTSKFHAQDFVQAKPQKFF